MRSESRVESEDGSSFLLTHFSSSLLDTSTSLSASPFLTSHSHPKNDLVLRIYSISLIRLISQACCFAVRIIRNLPKSFFHYLTYFTPICLSFHLRHNCSHHFSEVFLIAFCKTIDYFLNNFS